MLAALTGAATRTTTTRARVSQRNILDPPIAGMISGRGNTRLPRYCGGAQGAASRGLWLFPEPVRLPTKPQRGQALALGEHLPGCVWMFLGELVEQLTGIVAELAGFGAALQLVL